MGADGLDGTRGLLDWWKEKSPSLNGKTIPVSNMGRRGIEEWERANDPLFGETETRERLRAELVLDALRQQQVVVDALEKAEVFVESLPALRSRGGDSAAVPVLLGLLPVIDDVVVKMEMLQSIVLKPGGVDVVGPLIGEFKAAKHVGYRWQVGEALRKTADSTNLDDLLELVCDPSYGKSRQMIVLGLGETGDRRAVPVLRSLLHDPDVDGYAVVSLARLKAAEAIEDIQALRNHRDSWVRRVVEEAVASLQDNLENH